MAITMEPIGVVHTDADKIPRHRAVSEVKGTLVIDKKYQKGLQDAQPGQQIVVILFSTKVQTLNPIFLFKSLHITMKNWGFSASVHPTDPILLGCQF